MNISVVIPVYKCSQSIVELYERLRKTLDKLSPEWEIVFVNDHSPENDWDIIMDLRAKDLRVKGLGLSRNFGQHNAIFAGLDHSLGEWIVVMDGDLQDKPEDLIQLYHEAMKGYDVVVARRTIRYDNFLKKISSKLFYKILNYLAETNIDYTVGNFGIYHRTVINGILKMGDKVKFFPVMVHFVGFKRHYVNVQHDERKYGKTTYSFKTLFKLALNVILSFSDKPLRLMMKFGLLITISSILFLIYNLYRYFSGQILALGWTSLILSIWFFAGIIIFLLGMVGLYVGKTFENTKNRPVYFVKEKML